MNVWNGKDLEGSWSPSFCFPGEFIIKQSQMDKKIPKENVSCPQQNATLFHINIYIHNLQFSKNESKN